MYILIFHSNVCSSFSVCNKVLIINSYSAGNLVSCWHFTISFVCKYTENSETGPKMASFLVLFVFISKDICFTTVAVDDKLQYAIQILSETWFVLCYYYKYLCHLTLLASFLWSEKLGLVFVMALCIWSAMTCWIPWYHIAQWIVPDSKSLLQTPILMPREADK